MISEFLPSSCVTNTYYGILIKYTDLRQEDRMQPEWQSSLTWSDPSLRRGDITCSISATIVRAGAFMAYTASVWPRETSADHVKMFVIATIFQWSGQSAVELYVWRISGDE